MLSVTHLTKRYGDATVVDDVSLEVSRGECFGLLGPNGAGKTPTISMICGITPPDSGSVTLSGRRIESETSPTKRLSGYVPPGAFL